MSSPMRLMTGYISNEKESVHDGGNYYGQTENLILCGYERKSHKPPDVFLSGVYRRVVLNSKPLSAVATVCFSILRNHPTVFFHCPRFIDPPGITSFRILRFKFELHMAVALADVSEIDEETIKIGLQFTGNGQLAILARFIFMKCGFAIHYTYPADRTSR